MSKTIKGAVTATLFIFLFCATPLRATTTLSRAHKKILGVVQHFANGEKNFKDDAKLVRAIYLENNRLLPRYKGLLARRYSSGAIGTLVAKSEDFLPGDIHAFTPSKGDAGQGRFIFGVHLDGDQFVTVSGKGRVIVARLDGKSWSKRLLSTRRIIAANSKAYVAPTVYEKKAERIVQKAQKEAGKVGSTKTEKATMVFMATFLLTLSGTLVLLRPRRKELEPISRGKFNLPQLARRNADVRETTEARPIFSAI